MLLLVACTLAITCLNVSDTLGLNFNPTGRHAAHAHSLVCLFIFAGVTIASDDTVYICSNNGKLAQIGLNGSAMNVWPYWSSSQDFEGVLFLPERPGFLYLANEFSASIIEMDLLTFLFPRVFQLPNFNFTFNRGLQGIAFKPDTTDGTNLGLFFTCKCVSVRVRGADAFTARTQETFMFIKFR
jgi:hypothetical protein